MILTDQLRYPPPYESDEWRQYRHDHCAGQERLREGGVSFTHHYPMVAACAPSRACLLTGHYPSSYGATETGKVLREATNTEEMFWLSPFGVPTFGDWFRAAEAMWAQVSFRSTTVSSVASSQPPASPTHGSLPPTQLEPHPENSADPEPTADHAARDALEEQRRDAWPRSRRRDLDIPELTNDQTEISHRHGWEP